METTHHSHPNADHWMLGARTFYESEYSVVTSDSRDIRYTVPKLSSPLKSHLALPNFTHYLGYYPFYYTELGIKLLSQIVISVFKVYEHKRIH